MSPEGLAVGCVGITPPGALGVAFFYHLTGGLSRLRDGRVWFLVREQSGTTRGLLGAGEVRLIADDGRELRVPVEGSFHGGWADDSGRPLPEIVLICANPDQLFSIVSEFVELLERVHAAGRLADPEPPVPIVILAANGLYFQRVRQVLLEKIEESVMLGRLPDLFPDILPRIIGRWLRGVTIQTSMREGSGGTALYRPGPPGPTTLAGGQPAVRARALALLTALGATCGDAGALTPSAVEFHKAIVNLNGNLLGLLACIGEDGTFTPHTVAEVHAPERWPAMRELTGHVIAVGRAVRALGPDDTVDLHLARILEIAERLGSHVPSSVQRFEASLRAGTVKAEVPPTEAWLLQPLLHYARSSGLAPQVAYFEGLQAKLVAAVAAAGARRRGVAHEGA